jgi:hypothetical protein
MRGLYATKLCVKIVGYAKEGNSDEASIHLLS